jgi:hypothetical protein
MIDNQKFTKKNILAAHQTATNNHNQNKTLLTIQNTTSINYDTHKKTVELSYNYEKSLGIDVHNCLLVTPNDIPIELINQSTTTRETNSDPHNPHQKQKRNIQNKENNR